MAVISVGLDNVYSWEDNPPPLLVPAELLSSDERLWSFGLRFGEIVEIPDVAPGRYTVRAFLPSGVVLTKAVTVQEPGPIPVRLETPSSPHEWLGWETVIGDTAPGRRYRATMPAPTRPAIWMRTWSVGRDDGGSVWSPAPWPPSRVDSDLQVWKITLPARGDAPQALQVGGPFTPTSTTVLPAGGRGGSEVHVLLRVLQRGHQQVAQVDIGTSRRDVDGLLRFLNGGDRASLGALEVQTADLAESLLFSKMADVLGAVAGGYVLLALGAFERMHSWTFNLAEWFPEVSDGAIIHASRILRESDRPDWAEVRALLLDAGQRPTPMLTEGVHLLVRGLRLLQRMAPDDSEVAAALDRAESLAVAVDPGSIYTTFGGPGPVQPSPVAAFAAVPTEEPGAQWLPEGDVMVHTALPLTPVLPDREVNLDNGFVRPVVHVGTTKGGDWGVTTPTGARVLPSLGAARAAALDAARSLGLSRVIIEMPGGGVDEVIDLP